MNNILDLGTYTVQSGGRQQLEGEFIPLYSEQQLEEMIAELREMLRKDFSQETQAALQRDIAKQIELFKGHWFQRIAYPDHHLASTSNHDLAYIDEGGINTLNRRLTSEEASILRPYPKWLYIKPLLPNLAGKSVLELGCSNGFFCFRFAEMGARQVTGIEILERQHESALWSNSILGYENVSFLQTDFLMDLTIPKHDIVFLSEVHNHLLFPFYGLLRILSLANEMVILDTGAFISGEQEIELSTARRASDSQLIYHSYQLSDGLISNFLNLVGVDSSKITRYREEETNHILYMIDIRQIDPPDTEFIQKSLRLQFKPNPEKQSIQIQRLKTRLQRVRHELAIVNAELDRTRSQILSIESSKFWRLRKNWFKFKRLLGMGDNE